MQSTVRSVLQQTVLPLQLIIVDQNDDSEIQRKVEEMFANVPARAGSTLDLVYIRDPSIVGPAVARNRAMDAAKGEVWLFLDDDVTLEPNFIAELLDVYLSYPVAVGVSGIITNYPPPGTLQRLWNAIFFRGPFHDERQPIYWRAEQLRESQPLPVTTFTGACMSFRASAIHGQRFDEVLRSAYEEDIEFCLQMRPQALLVIAPGARLAHHKSPSGRSLEHHLKRETRATCYLYRKYWRVGLKNYLCFVWVNVGYALMATLASVFRLSIDPWRAVFYGRREAKLNLLHSPHDTRNFGKLKEGASRDGKGRTDPTV